MATKKKLKLRIGDTVKYDGREAKIARIGFMERTGLQGQPIKFDEEETVDLQFQPDLEAGETKPTYERGVDPAKLSALSPDEVEERMEAEGSPVRTAAPEEPEGAALPKEIAKREKAASRKRTAKK